MWNFQHTHAILPLGRSNSFASVSFGKAHVSFRSSHASKCDYFVIVEFFESFVGFFQVLCKNSVMCVYLVSDEVSVSLLQCVSVFACVCTCVSVSLSTPTAALGV